jgi:hypothetical protein
LSRTPAEEWHEPDGAGPPKKVLATDRSWREADIKKENVPTYAAITRTNTAYAVYD